jgi:hypothetical protein
VAKSATLVYQVDTTNDVVTITFRLFFSGKFCAQDWAECLRKWGKAIARGLLEQPPTARKTTGFPLTS